MESYPFGPPVALEVHPRYGELRRTAPVTRVRLPYRGEAWLITGHHELKQMMADPRFGTEALTREDIPRITPEPQPAGMILFKDAPEHTRLRRLVASAFTAHRVEGARAKITQLVESLLDGMAAAGPPVDFVEHFAWPLPVMAICDVVGIPYEERARFRHYADVVLSTTAYTTEEIVHARVQLREFLAELFAKRRNRPEDDLLTVLVKACYEDRLLSEQEMILLGVVLLVGGHEKAASQLGNFTYLLLRQPERYAALVADPSRIPRAVEELLRFVPLEANGVLTRVAKDDVRIGDVMIRRGEVAVGVGMSSNRDERVFTNPDHIDFDRDPIPHVAFGHGAHHCLGAQLARLEMQVAVTGLVRRFPTLRQAEPGSGVRWKTGLLGRGPTELLVTW
ncbi:MAG: cytochrome P450 [Kutzneria sp.]|nr:cytochrome P450 [Kutzneria sp.]